MRASMLLLASALLLCGVAAHAADAPSTTLKLVNVEYEGTKMWLPGTLVVKKGTKVTLKLINNVPSDPAEHGFQIPEFKVAAVVKRGEPKEVTFVADKEGVFPFDCQLHPAHVGGTLVVLP